MATSAPPGPRALTRHAHPPPGAPPLLRRAAAECLAAFALVLAGCGAAVTNAEYAGAFGTVGIGLVFGLVIMVMVYATDRDRPEYLASPLIERSQVPGGMPGGMKSDNRSGVRSSRDRIAPQREARSVIDD
jgi:hypothetical protein